MILRRPCVPPGGGGTGVGVLPGVGVVFGVGVGVGAGPEVCAVTIMPLILGWSAAPTVNWITTCPLLLTGVLKFSWMPIFSPPVAAKTSKLVNTCAPLIST